MSFLRMPKTKGKFDSPPMITVYPGYGYRAQRQIGSDWRLCVAGVVYQIPTEFSVRKRMLIRMLRQVMQVPSEALETELFRRRVSPFLANAQHRQQIVVRLGGEEFRLPKRTRRNGRFEACLNVPAALVEELATGEIPRVPIKVLTENPFELSAPGEVFLHNTRGVCVISDIDDTIKHSVVTDRKELLANTFLREFQCIPGMQDLYQRWSKMGVSFHYVSSSPWQLFESLKEMQGEAGFPLGALHLRNFRLRDQLLKRVKIMRRPGKATAINKLIRSLPFRKFILIGDSGEKDPEIYAKACREFPDQIAGVFIREIPERPMLAARLSRFEKHLNMPFRSYRDSADLEQMAAPLVESLSLATV